ncbi:hypothetical protein ABID99_000255 [Mucilaginibacter sp. OAE612]
MCDHQLQTAYSKLPTDMGIAFGPGYMLIRLQALRSWPVSAPIPNALLSFIKCRGFSTKILYIYPNQTNRLCYLTPPTGLLHCLELLNKQP